MSDVTTSQGRLLFPFLFYLFYFTDEHFTQLPKQSTRFQSDLEFTDNLGYKTVLYRIWALALLMMS